MAFSICSSRSDLCKRHFAPFYSDRLSSVSILIALFSGLKIGKRETQKKRKRVGGSQRVKTNNDRQKNKKSDDAKEKVEYLISG